MTTPTVEGWTFQDAQRAFAEMAQNYGPLWRPALGPQLVDDFSTSASLKDFCEALRRHRRDPERGGYPPNSADVSRQLTEIQRERDQQAAEEVGQWFQRVSQQEQPPQQEDQEPITYGSIARAVAHADDYLARAEKWLLARAGRVCYDCAGTGKAAFWHKRGGKLTEVLTRRFWVSLPSKEMGEYRRHIAICDCSTGKEHPHRAILAERFPGSGKFFPLWPRLEIIRKLCHRYTEPQQAEFHALRPRPQPARPVTVDHFDIEVDGRTVTATMIQN